jgi:phage gp36-like protein
MYSSQQLLADALGGDAKLIEALDDIGSGTLDTELVARILTRASNAVDAYLAGRYTVPLDPVPAIAAEAATIFACEIIYDRRRQGLDEKNPYQSRANDFRTELKEIADGKKSLDAVKPPAFTPGAVISECSHLQGSSL